MLSYHRMLDAFVELRYRSLDDGRFRQEFHRAKDTAAINRRVAELAPVADLYYGITPRLQEAGGAAACAEPRYLFVDTDTAASTEKAIGLQPTFLIQTSPGHGLFLWELAAPVPHEFVARANGRLQHHIGGDPACRDVARIGRVPGTLNHKYEKPVPVRCFDWQVTVPVPTVRDLVGHLPDPPGAKVTPIRPSKRKDTDDPLLGIPATEYVTALTGRVVGQDHKATCPFHAGGNERTPSLHAYDDPERGWYCWGCDEGGDIYSFAAKLHGLNLKRDFPAIKHRLVDELRRAAA